MNRKAHILSAIILAYNDPIPSDEEETIIEKAIQYGGMGSNFTVEEIKEVFNSTVASIFE